MTFENICTDFEISKQLRDAGYPQDSLFYWEIVEDDFNVKPRLVNYHNDKENTGNYPDGKKYIEKWLSAPTASEIGELLLSLPITRDISSVPLIGLKLACVFNTSQGSIRLEGDTEANARAKMWLLLKKEGLL